MLIARAVRNQPATLTTTFYNDEAPVSADGQMLVSITKADGTVLIANDTASPAATGVYTYSLPPQTALNYLTIRWSGSFSGTTRTNVSYCDVRGGELFSLAEGRASDPTLADLTKYPTQLLKDCRAEVEDEFEAITRVAFFPRYRRVTRDGTGTERMLLKSPHLRTLLSASIDGIALSGSDIAAVSLTRFGELVRTNAGFWTSGVRNVTVEVEYGYDLPPADVRKAALVRFRSRVQETRNAIPDRATSFTAAEGGTYSMAVAGKNGWSTGIPDVDAVLARYTFDIPGIG